MNFILQRFSDNRDTTLGLLFKKITDASGERLQFTSYTLEDEYRDKKQAGDTRIPAGFYEIAIRKEETPMTLKYRTKYPWFVNHIEILKVPGFNSIYLHIGNRDSDTDGCLLLGDNADNNQIGEGSISNSTNAFKRFYSNTYEYLSNGHKAFIEIRDEKFLLK